LAHGGSDGLPHGGPWYTQAASLQGATRIGESPRPAGISLGACCKSLEVGGAHGNVTCGIPQLPPPSPRQCSRRWRGRRRTRTTPTSLPFTICCPAPQRCPIDGRWARCSKELFGVVWALARARSAFLFGRAEGRGAPGGSQGLPVSMGRRICCLAGRSAWWWREGLSERPHAGPPVARSRSSLSGLFVELACIVTCLSLLDSGAPDGHAQYHARRARRAGSGRPHLFSLRVNVVVNLLTGSGSCDGLPAASLHPRSAPPPWLAALPPFHQVGALCQALLQQFLEKVATERFLVQPALKSHSQWLAAGVRLLGS
jgi:hypothetical protein